MRTVNLRQQLSQLNTILSNIKDIIIFLPSSPAYDQLAAGLGLYLGLLKQGKQTTIVSSSSVLVQDSDLVGIDKIKNSLDGKNLIISLPYEEGNIEKVSYNFSGDKFNLVIEPKDSSLKFSSKDIEFSTGGSEADFIFTIGVRKLSDIGKLYQENRDLFEKKELAKIDNTSSDSQFGKINIVNPKLPTLSEIIVLVLKNLGIVFDKDISTNLYKGLQKGTNNFDPKIVSALTFEAAAFCLRSGASKMSAGIQQSQKPNTSILEYPPKPAALSTNKSHIISQNVIVDDKQTSAPTTDQSVKNYVQNVKAPKKEEATLHATFSPTRSQTIPTDWLKPKIFSSTNRRDKN